MARTTSTVRVADIPSIVADENRGIVSLLGDHGGLSLITGEMHMSSVHLEMLRIETEHGSVYLAPDLEVEISEEFTSTLTADEERDVDWFLTWSVDHSDGPSTPRAAAERVWREEFGRTSACPDDACVFDVTDPSTGDSVRVDLGEEPTTND